MRRKIAVAVVLSMILPGIMGCANIENDAKRTETEGTAIGAGAGALLGGLLGAAMGGKKGAFTGAAIGVAVGGIAGNVYGRHVATEKQKYAKEEEWLDACIASLEETNQETIAYNEELSVKIETLEAETSQLATAYKAKKTGKKTLLAKKKTVDSQLTDARKKLDRARFELTNQEQVLAQARRDQTQKTYEKTLDNKIALLKANIAELETHTEQLASMSSRMSV
ncbi:hypothetical protein [Desulfocicer niacini]